MSSSEGLESSAAAANDGERKERPGLKMMTSFRQNSQSLIGSIVQRFSLSGMSGGDGWICEHCTYKNKNLEFLSCEICGMIREAPAVMLEVDLQNMEEPSELSSRFELASAEQEAVLQEAKQSKDDEDHNALIESRMQEIVDRQRQLYDEIAEHRVRRESIPYHLETQKSIKRLQELLHNQLEQAPADASFTPKTPERTSKKQPALRLPQMTATAEPQQTQQQQHHHSSDPPRPALSEGAARPTRRQLRRASHIKNPVVTMSTNPWEEKAMGLGDILSVQEELWDRVKGDCNNSNNNAHSNNSHGGGGNNSKGGGSSSTNNNNGNNNRDNQRKSVFLRPRRFLGASRIITN